MSALETVQKFLKKHKVVRNLFVVAGAAAVMAQSSTTFASDDKSYDNSLELVKAVTCLSRDDAFNIARMRPMNEDQKNEKAAIIDLYNQALTAYLSKDPDQIKKVAQILAQDENKNKIIGRSDKFAPSKEDQITINGETIAFRPNQGTKAAFETYGK